MNKLFGKRHSASIQNRVCQRKVTDFDFKLINQPKGFKSFLQNLNLFFIDRYECLMASKTEGEDFRQFINRHKRLLNDFKFTSLKEEHFKVLMLLTALKSPKDATLRQRILSKLGADGDNVKYDEIVQDCINFMTTISEAKLIENSAANRSINAVKPKWHKTEKGGRPNSKQGQSSSAPAQQCWRCGWTNHSHWECTAQVSEMPKMLPKWTFGRPMRQSAGMETEKQIANSKKENWKFTNWNRHESELRFAFQNQRGGRWQKHQIRTQQRG
ncbi:hypothetical protein niasHT_022728 [Heterodera trifolii]|uniref:Uncharacterized protein n=1 Tax=Heterodera trifolii TaxID=157864 RepID=A0ABD2KMV6_9BILA